VEQSDDRRNPLIAKKLGDRCRCKSNVASKSEIIKWNWHQRFDKVHNFTNIPQNYLFIDNYDSTI
jgi:hypothetical protein